MLKLVDQIKQIVEDVCKQEPEICQHYLELIKKNLPLTRDEGGLFHFCVYFIPFNPKTKQIFIVHHKKSGLWLSPGGHIDKGELLFNALNREIKEELGMENFFAKLPKPFLLTVTPINNPAQPICKEHLDIWFLVETDGKNFNVDRREFYATKWVSLNEAKQIVTDPANLKAFFVIENE